MAFTLDAVAQPDNVPPRVALTATESDPDLAIQSVSLFRDGVPLRFEPAVTGDSAVAYDYDAPFDVSLLYRADVTELGQPVDWVEVWTDLGDWTGSGWSAGSGVATSTDPGSVIYRDVSDGSIIQVAVVDPSNLTLQLTDADDTVVVSVLVSPDGTVTLSGTTTVKVTGSGDFTVSLAEESASVVGADWDTSVAYTGVATRMRLVAPAAATYVSKFGSLGTADGQFKSPVGLAVDGSGNIYVADYNNHRVQKFAPDGTFLLKFGTNGTGDGQFKNPTGIALDGSGNIYVAEEFNHRIQKFNSSGVYQSKFGSSGPGDGQLSGPRHLALDTLTTNVLIPDSANNRVQRFTQAGGSVDDITVRISLDEPVVESASDTATLSPTGANAGAWLTNAATPELAILAEAEPASRSDDYFIVADTRTAGKLAANTASLPIEGSPDVVTVTLGPRIKETWTLRVACTSQVAYQNLVALLANSSIVSLRFPLSARWVGLDTGFYAVGDVDASRIGHPQLGPIVVASLPLVPSRAPKYKPLWQWNWNTLAQTGMTWDDVNTQFPSWNDVLIGPN